jgi:hypothetical protein
MAEKVYLVWFDLGSYEGGKLEAIYARREDAEQHVKDAAASKKPFPGSDRLSVEDFTELTIQEWDVR